MSGHFRCASESQPRARPSFFRRARLLAPESGVHRRLARSDLDLHELAALPDEEVKSRLVAVRGLGEWTADWFLARHLARPNAWPWGDLALRKAVADLYGGLDVREARERFHPFENLSAHYLLLAHRLP